MQTPAQTLTHIQSGLQALADPQQVASMQAYMLHQFEFMGVRAVPRRSLLKTLPKLTYPQDTLLDLADALWALKAREFRYTAIDLLAKYQKRLDATALPHLQQLVQRDAWWDTVDGLAGVVGDILLRSPTVQPDMAHPMDAWLVHPSLWVRRVAMLHQLGWCAHTNTARLFAYALTLGHEKDFFIRKAIGWALRDYAKTQPLTVQAFVAEHAHRLSALTVREACKHLRP